MTQQVRALTVLAEDSSSVPGAHMVAHSYLQLQSQGTQDPLLTSVGTKHAHDT